MGTAAEIRERIGDRHVVFFDGVCNLCNGFVNFLIDMDRKDRLMFASLQSEEAGLLLSQDYLKEMASVVVLTPENRVFKESDAILTIAQKLGGIFSLIQIFRILPAGVRDGLYRWVARNRYKWFGKQDSCRVPTRELRAKFV